MDEILKGVLPSTEAEVKSVKVSWSGLDRKHPIGSSVLYDCENVSTYYAPYLSVSEKPSAVSDYPDVGYPLSLHAYSDMVVVASMNYTFDIENPTWNTSGALTKGTYVFYLTYKINLYRPSDGKIYEVKKDGSNFTDFQVSYYPGTPSLPHTITADEVKTLYNTCTEYIDSILDEIDITITGFQSYTADGEKLPVTNEPSKRLVFSLAQNIKENQSRTKRHIYSAYLKQSNIYAANELTATDGMPPIRFLTTHQGRVWGAENTVVSASAYANCANWETDLSYITNETDGYGASHAWVSSIQTDNYASGDTTGIYNYLGSLIVFREDYMFEVSGTKNPFRVNDIINKGTIEGKSVASCGGVLFFAGTDGVYGFTGNMPTCISNSLDIREIKKAVATADGRCYYLYAEAVRNSGNIEKKIYVYDTTESAWTVRSLPTENGTEVVGFTRVDDGVYALLSCTAEDKCKINNIEYTVSVRNGKLYKLDTLEYSGNAWFVDTGVMTEDTSGNITANPKRIKEIRLIAELEKDSKLNIFVAKADDVISEAEPAKTYENKNDSAVTFPVVLKIFGRSSYGYKIRLAGTGFARIYSMEVIYADGGTYTKADKDGVAKA